MWRRYSKARGGRDRRLLRVIPADARTRTCSPCCVVVALGGATGTAHPQAGSAGRARPSRSLAHIQATQVARTESTRPPSLPVKSLSGDAKPQVASAVKPRKTRKVHAWASRAQEQGNPRARRPHLQQETNLTSPQYPARAPRSRRARTPHVMRAQRRESRNTHAAAAAAAATE